MKGQEDFLSEVRELMRLAGTNNNRLSMEEIEGYFSEMDLQEAQLDMLCRYLEMNGVSITDRVRRGPDELTPSRDRKDEEELVAAERAEAAAKDPLDAEMVRIYKKEAARAKSLSPDQEYQLVYKLATGDENARNLLIEANLDLAIRLAGEYKGRGLPVSDLIQESNIGLMMAINTYEPEIDGPFDTFKEMNIRRQLETALSDYSHSTRSARKMASRVNELNDLATAFANEYEREASPKELAERMGIPEEEVRLLMKVSLDAIAVLDQGKIGK